MIPSMVRSICQYALYWRSADHRKQIRGWVPHLFSVCDVPEEIVEFEADRAYSRLRPKAWRIGLYNVAFLKEKIKVWHKDT